MIIRISTTVALSFVLAACTTYIGPPDQVSAQLKECSKLVADTPIGFNAISPYEVDGAHAGLLDTCMAAHGFLTKR